MTKHSYHEGKMTLHFILGGSRYRDSLQAGRFGIRTPVWGRIFAPVKTGPRAYPAAYTMGTGSFPGIKWLGRGVDNAPPHLALRLKRVELHVSSLSVLYGLLYGEISLSCHYGLRVEAKERLCW